MDKYQRAETDAREVPPEPGDHALEQTDQGDCAISLNGVIQELSECNPVSCALELLLEQGGWPRSPTVVPFNILFCDSVTECIFFTFWFGI